MVDVRKVLPAAAVFMTALFSWHAAANDYSAGWGPAVGSEIPMLEAQDHSGKARALADLAGEQGLLLFLSRSADW